MIRVPEPVIHGPKYTKAMWRRDIAYFRQPARTRLSTHLLREAALYGTAFVETGASGAYPRYHDQVLRFADFYRSPSPRWYMGR